MHAHAQAATGRMQEVQLRYRDDAGLTVVIAAKGYPGTYPKGSVIRGVDSVTGAKVRMGPGLCAVEGGWAGGGGVGGCIGTAACRAAGAQRT